MPQQTQMPQGLGGAPVNSGPIDFGASNITPVAPAGQGGVVDVSQQQMPDVAGTSMPASPSPAPLQQGSLSQTNPNAASQVVQGGAAGTPVNQSVIDLLNNPNSLNMSADLSKYGTQGSNPNQTQDIAQKYTDAFNANKSSPVPDTGAQAHDALNTYFSDTSQQTQQDSQQNFFDQQASMNPIVKSMYDQINQILSPQTTQQTFTQEYQNLIGQQGIPALQTQLMNIQNVMKGTEDDIRTEITKAGGFATESQVQALTSARNKVLQTQATTLSQQLQQKEDYVKQIMQFSQADRAEVDKQVEQKLGLTEKVAQMQIDLNKAATDNYQKIVDKVGYSGLAASIGSDKQLEGNIEQLMGLAKGALSNPTFLTSMKAAPTAAVQEYQFAQSQGFKGTFMDYQTQQKQATAGTWSAPYMLGGSYVQTNSTTGEVRQAVTPPNDSTTKTPTYSFNPTTKTALLGTGETAASVGQLEKDIAQYGAQYVVDNGQGLSPATQSILETEFNVTKTPPPSEKKGGIFGLGFGPL